MDLFPPLDVGDPRAFIAGAVAIFANYPPSVWPPVIDPVHGLPSEVARPSLADIKAACEKAYEPTRRALERERVRLLRAGEAERERVELKQSRRRGEAKRAAEKAELTELRALAKPGSVFGHLLPIDLPIDADVRMEIDGDNVTFTQESGT